MPAQRSNFAVLTWDGIAAALVTGYAIWLAGGILWFTPLFVFFVTGSTLGKLRSRKHPPRSAVQVIANGGPAVFAAVFYLGTGREEFAAAFLASLAAANSDTWATEIGSQFGKRFFRITNMEPSQCGRSGAVSIAGLIAAFIGAATVAWSGHSLAPHRMGELTAVAFGACLLDSILGDTVQGRVKFFTNDTVNLVSTLSAAFVALIL